MELMMQKTSPQPYTQPSPVRRNDNVFLYWASLIALKSNHLKAYICAFKPTYAFKALRRAFTTCYYIKYNCAKARYQPYR